MTETRRELPSPPTWAQPVKLAKPKAGDDPLAVAARERAGRGDANRRIMALVDWYACVQSQYTGAGCE